MQNFINPVYINNNLPLSYLKNNNNLTNPIQQNNSISSKVSFKGTEALAAYNYSLVNKNEIFNLPIIKPLNIPTKIEDIQGEKIYNSDNELVRIMNDNTTYYFRDNKLHYSLTKEKDSNIKWAMWFDGNNIDVEKILPDGTEYSTFYENGKPIQVTKYKMFSKGNEIVIDYLPKEKAYSIQKRYTENGKNYSSFARYDENKKCTEAFESEGMHDEMTDLYFVDGEPYSKTTSKSKSIDSSVGKDDIDLTNLEPSQFYHIDMDKINAIEGERKYYSNGKLEKIISNDGSIYTFLPEGILATIESKNKKIEFGYQYKDNKIHGHNITEIMPDGGIKKTQYGDSPNDGFDIWYENAGTEKHVIYNNKGNIVSYSNKQEGQKEISRDYDNDGNLIRCWDEE